MPSNSEPTRGTQITGGLILGLFALILLAYPAAFLVHVTLRLVVAGWDGPSV